MNRTSIKDYIFLTALTILALLVHGYHPAVEDAEIYLPGIKKLLNPSLYPFNSDFFQSHASMTIFPNLIAGSVRLFHLPLEPALMAWHLLTIFLLLLGCLRISRLCFRSSSAQWAGVVLVCLLLTIPVAGTTLYIMDEYLNTRSISTPALIFAVGSVLEKKYLHATLWIVFTALVHPLMSLFGVCYLAILFCVMRYVPSVATVAALFPPVTPAYRKALDSHSYFFLWSWQWYEWIGIIAPFALLWWFSRIALRRGMTVLNQLSRSLLVFGLCFFAGALVLSIPGHFENLGLVQPMRCLHLIYIFLFLIIGGFLGELLLKNHAWRWIVLFLPLAIGMWYSQRELFPATPHIEWPYSVPDNDWLRAFAWIRHHTPVDVYFALDPQHMEAPGEDQHGFRAVAERSMLADNVKDGGSVSMFPAIAEKWQEQLSAEQGWKHFRAEDFRRLKARFGVRWVVLQQPGVPELVCPYQNKTLLVCRID
jgi:hypothetical protein